MRDLQWQYPDGIEQIESRITCLETVLARVAEYAGKLEDRIKPLEDALSRADLEASREYRKYALTRRVAGHEESRRATE